MNFFSNYGYPAGEHFSVRKRETPLWEHLISIPKNRILRGTDVSLQKLDLGTNKLWTIARGWLINHGAPGGSGGPHYQRIDDEGDVIVHNDPVLLENGIDDVVDDDAQVIRDEPLLIDLDGKG